MLVKEILTEMDLGIDDVRWYLAWTTGERFLSYREEPEELARWIWSGRLAADLHRMEERYLEELQDALDRKLMDEAAVRGIMREMVRLSRKRRRGSP